MPDSTNATSRRKLTHRQLRVLVADDDRDTVDGLKLILEDEGHVVHAAYTGKDAARLAYMLRPDALILDVSIPGLSGYAVAQTVRQSFTNAACPLMIAISGMWIDGPDLKLAHQVGFDHHLGKPAAPADLLRLLEPLFRKSQ